MTVVFQSTTEGVTFAGTSTYAVTFAGFLGSSGTDISAWLMSRPGYDADNPNLYLNSAFEWVEIVSAPTTNNAFTYTFPFNLS